MGYGSSCGCDIGPYYGYGYNSGNGFVLIVVLFILLIIVGAACLN
ncbi:YjcZ family sporulation protein [Ornithinibacillus sp. BX22]|uniref:YjcZ family sporulation protein n=1 Tax=Ornithinibacillus hominis TaxID=2763055 RepID=A0A923L888_9BACI|nr:YjcZ family sporulation protein [Ornithinibacillus hominis]MBC5638341.1 YjcZ family sporulation protein [Ornithinibacillus hominis]